ncbi:MAG: TIGR00269 family protein [Candidatus Thermoplasmatota archaeon]
MIPCSKCGERSVVFVRYSGRHLCAEHLMAFVEGRVAKEVRSSGKLPKGSKIACAVSGGKDSTAMLHILRGLFHMCSGITLHAIIVDEGICGYRPHGIEVAERECSRLGIELAIVRLEELFGYTLDEAVERMPKTIPCTICGVWRRAALNRTAKRLGAARLALGHNLNDFAGSVLMNVCRADVERFARMGPHEDVQPGLVPRLLPLRLVPEEEVMLYSWLKGWKVLDAECPYAMRSDRNRFVRLIAALEDRTPGTRHSIARFWEETRGAVLRSHPQAALMGCERCGEPTASSACRACALAEAVRRAQGFNIREGI